MVRCSTKSVEWSKRIERFTRSGLSLGRFCMQENVGVQSFYYWKKRLQPTHSQRSRDRVSNAKTDEHTHGMSVRCTVQVGAIRIECHIESAQAFGAILDWAASQQGSLSQNTPLFQQLVVQD
jgi:hypothetical protein